MSLGFPYDATFETFASQWLANAIENAKTRILQDLTKLPFTSDSKRIIICGSGPSLNKDIPALRDIFRTENAPIIANHSNLSTLLVRGIIPTLVVIADSGEPTYLRLAHDVLPHFNPLLKNNSTFILPTHANPKLVKMLLDYGFPTYFFASVLRKMPDNLALVRLYNQTLHNILPQITTEILQAGSVANASILVCNALQLDRKLPKIEYVQLSGVDYSYPNGITRCEVVTWNDELGSFDKVKEPTNLGPEILRVKCNGLDTSEDQLIYYRDLRFISQHLLDEDQKPYFKIYTTQLNFIADFLEIKPLC